MSVLMSLKAFMVCFFVDAYYMNNISHCLWSEDIAFFLLFTLILRLLKVISTNSLKNILKNTHISH